MKALLGVQSHYSFHWGTAAPALWLAQAEKLGYEYLAIADHASVCGLPEIIEAAKKRGIKPIYGASFPLTNRHGVIACAASGTGYGNLCQAITDWLKRCDARAEEDDADESAKSDFSPDTAPAPAKAAKTATAATAAAAGGIPALSRQQAALFFAGQHRLDDLVFITDDLELWQTLRGRGLETYWRIGPTLTAPPDEVPEELTLFAPGPFMMRKKDFTTHRLLRAIGGATTLDRIPEAEWLARAGTAPSAPVLVGSPENYLRRPEEYEDVFAIYTGAIGRADAVARRLASFTPEQAMLHPPSPYAREDAEKTGATGVKPALERLRELAYEGAAIRYGTIEEPVRKRLEHELDLIGRKGFSEYFLVVHDIVNRLAGGDGRVRRGRSITCGRGSGAASLVNYCLGVTNVDAHKHDLMFERFLNEARVDPPDIDVDFAWDERDDVLARVFGDYGGGNVARVANHNRYDWRGAFRAVARTMGYSDPEITRHIKDSPSVYGEAHPGLKPLLATEEREHDESATERLSSTGKIANLGKTETDGTRRIERKFGVLRRDDGTDWNAVVQLARELVGIPHGLSMHCGGVVISPGPIARVAPTILSRKGYPTIQWEKDGTENMGLVKIDLLGNRSLAVIRDAIRAIAGEENRPEEDIIRGDPADDPATQALVGRGDTFGVFYFESPAMRLLLARARRGDFAHSVIHSSIIRPAANAFITEYLLRLHGKPWRAVHPLLDGLFDESYGIPVYQEDVVKLAMALAGYDYAQADRLRKCLGKRDAHAQLSALFPALAEAARTRGVDEETLAEFWQTLMSMTGYSFCKPHSASYARVSYEAAYLRAHYPAHFIAAVLSNGGGFYSTESYVSEAMRLGLTVLGPDVNASETAWRAESARSVRTGLMAVSGLSRKAMLAIVRERERNGRYLSIDDFFNRLRLDSDDARKLALVGGFDALAPDLNRPQLLWLTGEECNSGGKAGSVAKRGKSRPADDAPATASLFGPRRPGDRPADGASGVSLPPLPTRRVPDLPPYSRRQRLSSAYSGLGFVPGFHPLALFAEEILTSLKKRLGPGNELPGSLRPESIGTENAVVIANANADGNANAEASAASCPILINAGDLSPYAGKTVTILAWPVTAKIVETKHGDAMMFQSFEDARSLYEAVLFPDAFKRYHRFLAERQPLWVTGRIEIDFGVPTLQVHRVEQVVPPGASTNRHQPGSPPPPACDP